MAWGGGGSSPSRLCLCILLALAVICSARNTIFLSEGETSMGGGGMEGRSLKIKLDDYAPTSANSSHNPKSPTSGRGGRG